MPLLQKNKIAFVTPWFGESIPGGAESATRALIQRLKSHFDIEVLTTCVKDFHSNWNDDFWKEGEYKEMDIVVRRFKVRKSNEDAFNRVNAKLMSNLSISKEEERTYISEMIRSISLNDFLEENKEKYSWFVFMPYMFGTTYDGIKIVKSKSILIPCLHDESYAYMAIYGHMFSLIEKAFFLTMTEKQLAEKLFPNEINKFKFCGLGLDVNIRGKKGSFNRKYGIGKFILCAGRKDSTKNTPELIDFFDRFQRKTKSSLKLVLVGPGEVDLPDNPNIIDLGFLSKEDKYNAMADALFLCNPSHNESFSIVVMESWLCESPVLVSGDCSVTKDHVLLSNGGLFYNDYYSFFECLHYYETHQSEAIQMAKNGKEYVVQNFNWPIVVQNYLNILNG